MRCSYNCNQEAKVKCGCALPYMCHAHFGSHILKAGSHSYEAINIDFESSRLGELRSSITRRIQKIDLAKNEITSTTKTLIKRIENMHHQVLNQLDTINNFYFELLKKDKFSGSEMETIENIESKEIIVQTIDIDKIQCGIRSEYEQELVKYMDKAEYTKIKFLEHHNGRFLSGCITTDGKTLVTGGRDATIRVWNLIEKKQKFVLHGHLSSVICVTLTGDSKNIISGSYDASVRIWNLKEKKQVAVLREHKGVVYAVYFVEAKSLIISGGLDRVMIIWDFKKQIAIQKISFEFAVHSLALISSQLQLLQA